MYLPWSAARANFYNVAGYPTVRFDGSILHYGSYGSAIACANAYRTSVNQRLAVPSNLAMHGTYNFSSSTISLTATIRKVDAVTLTNPIVVMAVLEDDVHSGAYTYEHVVRAGGGQAISLPSAGDSVTVTIDLPIGAGWNMDNINCAAWVQKSTGDLQVYQSCELGVWFDFMLDFDTYIASIPDGNGEAIFQGTLSNQLEVPQNLTVSLNNTFGWPAEFMVAGEADYHTDASAVSLGVGEAIGVTLKVTTDGTVRIGEGGLRVQSPTTTVSENCRVFNGGPAILFVDDDGAYPQTDELPLLDALDAANALYDHWDVRRGHGRNPTVEEMIQYDAAIWHVGIQTNMIGLADVELFTDYLNAGGGLILSYQHFLSYADTASAPVVPVFLSDYLGIDSYVMDAGADSALGVAGDPISDGMNIRFAYPSSIWDKADALTPNALGTTFLHSSTGNQVAIRSDLAELDARAVFFACLLNVVGNSEPDPDNLSTLLVRAVDWVVERGSAAVDEHGPLPGLSAIGTIAPNPFHLGLGSAGTASIRLRIDDAAAGQPVRLDVFDISGRLVNNLVDGRLPAGTAVAAWNGLDASGAPVGSGVYYLRFTTPAGTHRAPMTIVR